MSAFSTLEIDRKEAEEMVRAVRAKRRDDPVSQLSDEANSHKMKAKPIIKSKIPI